MSSTTPATPDYILPTLFQAIENNDEDLLKRLLKKRPGLAMKCDASGRTGLMLAAREGCIDCVEALIAVSDPSAVDEKGSSALTFAARMGNHDCLQALLPVSDVSI